MVVRLFWVVAKQLLDGCQYAAGHELQSQPHKFAKLFAGATVAGNNSTCDQSWHTMLWETDFTLVDRVFQMVAIVFCVTAVCLHNPGLHDMVRLDPKKL